MRFVASIRIFARAAAAHVSRTAARFAASPAPRRAAYLCANGGQAIYRSPHANAHRPAALLLRRPRKGEPERPLECHVRRIYHELFVEPVTNTGWQKTRMKPGTGCSEQMAPEVVALVSAAHIQQPVPLMRICDALSR